MRAERDKMQTASRFAQTRFAPSFAFIRAGCSLSFHQAIADENLTLVTPYHPKAGFSVGAAMGRNKLIYALADYALVIASDAETGGTWAGATEALKNGWAPVFACEGDGFPEGNRLLCRRGAIPFPMPFPGKSEALLDWLAARPQEPKQGTLF